MKIIRFLTAGREYLGRLHDDGRTTLLEGDLFGMGGAENRLRDTGTVAAVEKLLSPVEPRDILCIGLNYKQHAAESGAEPPAHPVLFLKNSAAVQHPGDPIVLPRKLRSDEVDYECELAVVIGWATCLATPVPMMSRLVTGSEGEAEGSGAGERRSPPSVRSAPPW
jgi:2-keto-4-pentenoate hydratase/2-oxohepta-3-ene-1,7-dioic acid hydratase in catechol pathway